MERGVVGGERSDERHVCGLADGDRYCPLRFLEGAVGFHRAPAAVQEEQVLSFFHVGHHFFGDRFVIARTGEDEKDVGIAGFFERACHGQVEGGIHLTADIERMRLPELALLFISDVEREGNGDEMQVGGGSEPRRSCTDDGNFHKKSSIRWSIILYYICLVAGVQGRRLAGSGGARGACRPLIACERRGWVQGSG